VGFGEFLNHWWNLPFLVMLGLVVVFALLQAIGLAGHDADADVDHDVDVDADADADTDADADADADAHADGMGWHDVLSFFGIGRVPFMVVWVALFLFGGIAGIVLNSALYTRTEGVYPAWGFPVSLAGSLAIGLACVRIFSRVAARFVDTGGRGASTKHELAGKTGTVASALLDAKFGEIRVRDDRGNELLVHAKLGVGDAPLGRGAEVILVDYDPGTELFSATPGGARVLGARVGAEEEEEEKPEAEGEKQLRSGERR
jgi:hypothetical protein